MAYNSVTTFEAPNGVNHEFHFIFLERRVKWVTPIGANHVL